MISKDFEMDNFSLWIIEIVHEKLAKEKSNSDILIFSVILILFPYRQIQDYFRIIF